MVHGKRFHLLKIVMLVVAVISAAYVAGVCVAKMIDTVEADSDAVRVASWSVSANGDNSQIKLTAGGEEKSYTFTVENNSEVSTKYEILLSNIPSGVKVGLDNGEPQAASAGSISFSDDSYVLNMTDHKTQAHTLKFVAPLEDDSVAISERNISINVNFAQENPEQ